MTKQNPEKDCKSCSEFQKNHDFFVICSCCEDCTKLTEDYLKENPHKRGLVLCIPCFEESKKFCEYRWIEVDEDKKDV